MFPHYFIQHPTEVRDVYLGPGAYILAALAGPLFALRTAGLRAAMAAAGPTLLALAALAVTFAATMYMSKATQSIVLVFALIWLVVYQARKVIEIIRTAYSELGWIVHEI